MKRVLQLCAIFFVSIIALSLEARPEEGFFKGPYLAVSGGVMQAGNDYDSASRRTVGNDFEPAFGFMFGWNILDSLATELQGRYSTNGNDGRRLHIAAGNLYAKWTPVVDALTDFRSWRIMPFLKGGGAFRASILPGNINSTDSTETQLGFGPAIGGGIAFLTMKYLFFGIDLQEEFLYFDSISETVSGVPNTPVYKGGWHPSFGGGVFIGVHY